MSKKDKMGLDKVVNRINKEFEKTSSQFEKLVGDAFKQLDSLQSQVHEPIKKIMEDMDKIRDRELTRFQSEFDKRMKEFSDLQSQLLQKIGVESASKKPAAKTSRTTKKTGTTKKTTTRTASKRPATKTTAKTSTRSTTKKAASKPAAPKSTAKKAPAKKTPAKRSPAKTATKAKPTKSAANASGNELTKLTGVGPAVAKRLNAAGIKTLKQIAAPSEQDKKALADFNKVKGFSEWQAKAKQLTS